MDDDVTKLGLAVVAAAVILVVGYVGYQEYARQRDIDQVQAAFAQLGETGRQVVAQSQAEMRHQQEMQAQQQAEQRARRWLAPNQRCVGGVVIQVDGSTYTQLGTIAYPIHCNGAYADQPLR